MSLDNEEDQINTNTKIDEIVVIPKNMNEGIIDSVNENGFVQNPADTSVFDPQLYHSASSDEAVEVLGNDGDKRLSQNDV